VQRDLLDIDVLGRGGEQAKLRSNLSPRLCSHQASHRVHQLPLQQEVPILMEIGLEQDPLIEIQHEILLQELAILVGRGIGPHFLQHKERVEDGLFFILLKLGDELSDEPSQLYDYLVINLTHGVDDAKAIAADALFLRSRRADVEQQVDEKGLVIDRDIKIFRVEEVIAEKGQFILGLEQLVPQHKREDRFPLQEGSGLSISYHLHKVVNDEDPQDLALL
jgi:hypothetical protein